MSATEGVLSRPGAAAGRSALATFARRHPLIAYYLWAFIAVWAMTVPLVISQRGLGWLLLPDSLLLVLYVGGTFVGPLPAALVLTGLTEGRSGVRALLLRMVQWRVGIGWYLLVIVGYPLLILALVTPVLGFAPWGVALSNPSLVASTYLPAIAIGLFLPGIQEEPGWRGFAVPRLQRMYGPMLAALIQGVLHALWHTPGYFIPGAVTETGFDLGVYVGNSMSIIAFTFVWNWLFNNAGGSVLFAILVHATTNATGQYINQLSSADVGWWGYASAWLVALLIIACTHGRLGYRGAQLSAKHRI